MRKENKRSFVVCRLNSMELVCQNYWKIINCRAVLVSMLYACLIGLDS